MDCFASLAMTSGHADAVGWAKRSVPTVCERSVGWWARRMRAFAHPTQLPYFNVIASPLKSAFAISPVCRPASSSTAPFWLVSTIARAPLPTARPAPAAP